MRLSVRVFVFTFLVVSISCGHYSCTSQREKPYDVDMTEANFWNYLEKGDEFYAKKSSLRTFLNSRNYYDTAAMIAHYLQDTVLIAESTFAIGRVYDAWSNEPDMTVRYYKKAAELYGGIDSLHNIYLYLKFHVAHAYAKANDTVACIQEINEFCGILDTMESGRRQRIRYLPELAMTCTDVGAYPLAIRILNDYTIPSQVKNDSLTLNHRDHYIMTRAKIEVLYQKRPPYHYLDTLEMIYNGCRTPADSMFYSDMLEEYFALTGDYKKAYEYQHRYTDITFKVLDKKDYEKMGLRLAELEMDAIKQQNRLDRKSNIIYLISFSGLGLLAAGSLYSNILIRRSRDKYFKTTKKLEKSNQKTSLLYKELHHRIKNNLHMIFSLLQMQERRSDNPVTIDNLKSARLRIESIAVMHEEMMQQEYKVDFKNFLHRMIAAVTECFSYDREIVTHLNINDAHVPQKQSFPLALIINEWISNSIKHARIAGKKLEIWVDIIEENNKIRIEYKDNGDHTNMEKPQNGLGTQIIQLLSKQLNTSVLLDSDNPFHYTILMDKG